ncbi:MAG: hypothetical protein WC693_05080 [Patescibacteria group bacterium]
MPESQFRNRDDHRQYDRRRLSISDARSFEELDGALDADEKITDVNRKQYHDRLALFKKGEMPSQQLDQLSGLGVKAVDLLRRDWQRMETAQLQRTHTEYRQLLSKYDLLMQEAPRNPRMNDQALQKIMLARDATVERIGILHNEINDRFPKHTDRERYFESPESPRPIPGAGTMTMSGELPPPGGDDPKRSRWSRLLRRKKDNPVPAPADADSSAGAIPTPDTNVENNNVKLSDTARGFLMYSDSFPKSSEEISRISPEEVAMLNMHADALDSMKDDPNFEPIVTQIREKFNSAMEQMGLTASPLAMSESWTYEELADAKLLHDNSDERRKADNPLTDVTIQDQIASKQLGSEMRIANSKIVQENPDDGPVMVFAEHESLKNLDTENPNYPEIMALLQKGYEPEGGAFFTEADSTRLGALIRQNLGEENVSVPDLTPDVTEEDADDAVGESKGKWSWLRRRKKGDTEPPKEQEERKSVLGRMWRGEYVSQEEKSKARVIEKAVLGTGKTAEFVSYLFGAKTALRLADRWAKRNARMGEVRRIREDVTEESNLRKRLEKTKDTAEKAKIQTRLNELNLGETETEDTRIQQRINSIRSKIAESKYLSPEKRTALEKKLGLLEEKWITGEAAIQNEMTGEIDTEIENHDVKRTKKLESLRRTILGEITGELDQNVGEKAKRMDYAKETVGGISVVSGAFTVRMGALGAIALGERYKNLKATKTEGERVTPKELIIDGVRDMALEMFGQGKLKELKGKQKAAGVVGAWAKAAMPAMIAAAGFSEVAEKGAGTFSKSIEHAGDRFQEIQKAIESMAHGGDPGRALLLILNWHETLRRTTMGLYKGHSGYSPSGAVPHEDLAKGIATAGAAEVGHETVAHHVNTAGTAGPQVSHGVTATSGEGVLTPEDKAFITKPETEHSGVLQPKDYTSTFGAHPAETMTTATPPDAIKVGLPDASKLDVHGNNTETGIPKYGGNIEPKVTTPIGTEQPTPGLATEPRVPSLESSLGINSQDGVNPEEMKKVVAELAGSKSADADKLLAAWEDKGLVNHDAVLAARFPVEHASLNHAGFHAETAHDKVGLTLDLGKEGTPKYLEQAFYRVAMENAKLGDEITNVEGARILNVGANMTALSEGHNVAGVSAEDFTRHVSVVDGKITISDYEGFHRDVLDKLTVHAEKIITPENVGNTGAVAYLDDIKNETWADMAKPEGAEVHLDHTQIDQAEGHLFKAMVHDSGAHTGLGENVTDIHMTDQDTGTFNLAGETVTIDHGMITGIGDTHFDPLPMNSDAAHAKLMEEASKIEAHRLEDDSFGDSDDAKSSAQSSSVGVTGGSGDVEGANKPEVVSNPATPEQTTEVDPEKAVAEAARLQRVQELTKADQLKMLEKLGFGKGGQGEQEWEFLKNKSVADLLNKDIEGHSGNTMDYLEGRHRGKLRKLIELAIRKGEITNPSSGGPQKIGEAVRQIIEGRVTEQANLDLHNTTAILATPNLNPTELAAAENEIPKIVPDNVEPIHAVESPDGSAIRFDYGADGKIIGVHPHIEDMKSPLTSLNEGYRDMLAQQYAEEGTKLPMASYEVVFENNVRQLEAMQHSLSTMEAAGNGDTPEAVYLKDHIHSTTAQLEARFGDVLKDTVNAPAPDAGTAVNSTEVPPVTPENTVPKTQPIEASPTEQTPQPAEIVDGQFAASGMDIKAALENLFTGILANMDNITPDVLKSLEGVTLHDIASLNDTTLLENMKEGAQGVVMGIQNNPPAEAPPEYLESVARGYKAIIEVIDIRLGQLKA